MGVDNILSADKIIDLSARKSLKVYIHESTTRAQESDCKGDAA